MEGATTRNKMSGVVDVKDYKDIMYRVSNKLERSEAEDIAILTNLEQMFHSERQFIIFVQLERRQIISEQCPQKLVELLRRIDRHDLAKLTEKLNAALKKRHKKKAPISVAPDPAEWRSADFAIARSQVEQLACSLKKLLQPDSVDPEIEAALEELQGINKHLSRSERRQGLPPTAKEYTSSFVDDSDSSLSSCHSSLNSEINEGEALYEPLNYGQPQPEVGTSNQGSPKIDSRPPLPAPKPKPKPKPSSPRATALSRENTEECSGMVVTPTLIPRHQIPLSGMLAQVVNSGNHHATSMGRSSTSLSLTSLPMVGVQYTECEDETNDTGDSGHSTGSGSGGFTNATSFLKVPLVPKHKPPLRPPVSPKPQTVTQRYTPLSRSSVQPSDYTKLQKSSNSSSNDQLYYSTARM